MENQTLTIQQRQEKAESLLDTFSKFTEYQHSAFNPYRKWLNSNPTLTPEQVVEFLCFWYPVSRHQPQILLRCTAAYDKWQDRKLMMLNYLEEDGMVREGDEPHYMLLQRLLNKLDNKFVITDDYKGDAEADIIVTKFHDSLNRMNSAEATGFVAAVEHPALDISFYFNKIIDLCGRPDLLKSDIYLTIHVAVEPDHIIWAHGTAEHYIEEGKGEEVINAFKSAMSFWTEFWALAFKKLGYPN